MTEQAPQQPQNGIQEAILADYRARAQADEAQALMEATIASLQQRVVALNVECRVRDDRIAELERELADRQGEGVPQSGDQNG